MYNNSKITKFYELTLEDYNRNLVIEDIAKVDITEKTDNSFIQIGLRPLVDEDMFILPNFHPELPGIGRLVAVGERDFLIQAILAKKEIKHIGIKEDIQEFPKYLEFNDACILISTKFYVEIFTKFMYRIDYEERYPRLDYRYRIISVPEKVLGDKIIIIGKDAVLWKKQLFDNQVMGTKEKLDLSIKPTAGGKVDITIRSVNKIEFIDEEAIKILEVNKNDSNNLVTN